VDLTLRELRDPALLRQTLADAGVPAIVNFGTVTLVHLIGLGRSAWASPVELVPCCDRYLTI
jgi:hypothetical protein